MSFYFLTCFWNNWVQKYELQWTFFSYLSVIFKKSHYQQKKKHLQNFGILFIGKIGFFILIGIYFLGISFYILKKVDAHVRFAVHFIIPCQLKSYADLFDHILILLAYNQCLINSNFPLKFIMYNFVFLFAKLYMILWRFNLCLLFLKNHCLWYKHYLELSLFPKLGDSLLKYWNPRLVFVFCSYIVS